MKNLEEQLTEILADSHVHEVLSAWLSEHASGVLVRALMETRGLDELILSLSFRGRHNQLTELKDEMEALHERGQNELNK